MKDLDRKVGLVAFPERRSKIALEASGRFKFLALGREYFQDERARWAEFEKDGFTHHTYHSWLIKKRAPDTWDNKVRFLEHFNAQRRSR